MYSTKFSVSVYSGIKSKVADMAQANLAGNGVLGNEPDD